MKLDVAIRGQTQSWSKKFIFLLCVGMLKGEVKMSPLQSGDRKSLTSERSSLSKNLGITFFFILLNLFLYHA